jgi:lysozyme
MISVNEVGNLLWKEEGFVSHAYEDSEGFLTIGPGILIDRRKGGGISPTEGRFLMENRVRLCEEECIKYFTWWWNMDQVRQQVIVAMAYQLGAKGVSGFKKMIAAITRKDWDAAADEMIDSAWYKQTPSRAKRMADIFRSGEWPDG